MAYPVHRWLHHAKQTRIRILRLGGNDMLHKEQDAIENKVYSVESAELRDQH